MLGSKAVVIVACISALTGVCAVSQTCIAGRSGAAAYVGANGPSFSAVPDGPGTSATTIFAWDE